MKPLILLAALALCGCDEKSKEQGVIESMKSVRVVRYDGCQYLVYHIGTNVGTMTHKGNCDNPIHRHAEKE